MGSVSSSEAKAAIPSDQTPRGNFSVFIGQRTTGEKRRVASQEFSARLLALATEYQSGTQLVELVDRETIYRQATAVLPIR